MKYIFIVRLLKSPLKYRLSLIPLLYKIYLMQVYCIKKLCIGKLIL